MLVRGVVHQFVAMICLFAFSYAFGEEQLQTKEITKIMQQILDQHLGEKEMSNKTLKNAFRIYIDQFDPYRIYLLEEEVSPWINLNDTETAKILDQYKRNDFSAFTQLNQLIQKSILRAREIRTRIEQNPNEIFIDKPDPLAGDAGWQDPDLKLPFAKNSTMLEDRIRQHLIRFVNEEMKEFGKARILRNEKVTLTIYEKGNRALENSYLFVDNDGHPLAPAEQENLFVIHVLKALANSLDAHTTFYNNTEAYEMRVRLEKQFEGVGLILREDVPGHIFIKGLLEGTPAAKNGQIKVGDRLIAVDQHKISQESLKEVRQWIQGEKNTVVVLKIERPATQDVPLQEFEVKLQREPIVVKENRLEISDERFADGIIGKIVLHSFYQGEGDVSSVNDVRNAIQELKKKGKLKGLILDMRENSGGFLTQAIKVVGLFIRNGVVVISKYSDGTEHVYRDIDGSMIYDGPLIVLISKATASAAEIVAQALQDYGKAIIVGDEHTYGKGTIQSQTVTNNKAASYFKVTVGEYYTVSGKTPQITGVKSDIVVPGPFNFEHIGEEYLEYAVKPSRIKPEYQDDLQDLNQNLRPWYMHYYLPTIQPKEQFWSSMMPALKRNSEYRITHNKNYQTYLRILKGIKEEPEEDENDLGRDYSPKSSKEDFGADDLQMDEAVNILKDMIIMQTQYRHVKSLEALTPFSGS